MMTECILYLHAHLGVRCSRCARNFLLTIQWKNIGPTPVQCWANVGDIGSALRRRACGVSVLFLMYPYMPGSGGVHTHQRTHVYPAGPPGILSRPPLPTLQHTKTEPQPPVSLHRHAPPGIVPGNILAGKFVFSCISLTF